MHFQLSEEVAEALESHRPVVALESTVIAHGLPRPQNVETARRLEQIVRDGGGVPATIAVFDGVFHVGLTDQQIEFLATDKSVRKISRRDIAIATAKRLNCATTVATTAFAAHEVGIKVFATGGIGGVHRGYSADVSADLVELARTPITVVCSGPKIVLDVAATREWLETFGVTVLGWQCDEMPAFYSRSSGLAVDERVEDGSDVANIADARDEIGLSNAILVTAPVPDEFAIDSVELDDILDRAVGLASEQKISGKELTPFLLAELSRQTGGRTLQTNIALLENNACVAVEIAKSITYVL
jgi:pseudouridine-5'-phosphate glycosidase